MRNIVCLLSLLALVPAQDDPLEEGSDSLKLYALHCSPCHGPRGRGDGPGGRFLDPPPRDLRAGPFRLVSTLNGRPSHKDLHEAIAAGIPGTAMLPFAHLGERKVRTLVEVVRAFNKRGLEELYKDAVASDDELRELVQSQAAPGELIPRGPETPDTIDSRARGRLRYMQMCAACHGADGRGTAMPVDPTAPEAKIPPRNLTEGVMKGGIESMSLFNRIRAGMPGSAMPAVTADALGDDGVWDIVHYLRSIIPAGAQALHSPMGWRMFVPKIEGELPTDFDDPRFAKARDVHVALAPFRAAEFTVRGIIVRAIHDGTHVIFRARYADATRDVPGAKHPFPPDGLAARVTNYKVPPVLPIPGLPLPLDRAMWLAGAMPDEKDPVFDHVEPRFLNPDRVCISPIGPEHVGRGTWRDRTWSILLPVKPERGGQVESGGTMGVSFAVFDGNLRRGPLPVAFSPWQTLVFE
ncbi:MAG: hypothetical protein CMJ90_10245 [Planctomycetes bacterium]|nr:hypothetical protein [Planctomycetota bacterium]